MTFPQRIEELARIAQQLAAFSVTLLEEVEHMQAAASRFDKRQAERPTRKATA